MQDVQSPRIGLRSERIGRDARRALGGLLPLVDEPGVRDVLVQARDGIGRLWIDRGYGVEAVPGWELAACDVRALGVALIAAGGRHVDELNPCADVRLGDGIRVHVALDPIATRGTAVSIRLPSARAPSFAELVRAGLCSEEIAAQLESAVLQRRNLLICGGTSTGKTTLLSSLLALVPANERIVSIEDVAELRPVHPHHISLEARQAGIEGVGEITLERLLREALRMRPDRIVLGECRGPEIATLLSALNTGHEGGAGTLHANRIEDAPARIEALGMLAGLAPETVARQAASALHLVVQLGKRRGRHAIEGLGALRVGESGALEVSAY